jgi:hypothetical protein
VSPSLGWWPCQGSKGCASAITQYLPPCPGCAEGREPKSAGRGELGRLRRREMTVVQRHGGIALEKGRFDDQKVRVPDVLRQPVRGLGVADHDELCTTRGRPKHVFWLDCAAVMQRHEPSLGQFSANRPVRDAKRRKAMGCRCRRARASNENAKLSASRWRTGKQSTVNSPASNTRLSDNGTSSSGMGARPSPQSPASIRTTTSSVLFPP